MIDWIATGILLFWLWTTEVGFWQALSGCLWVAVRKVLPGQKRLANAIMPRMRTIEVNIPGHRYPFYARWPASDLHILHTIIRKKEYAPIADLMGNTTGTIFLDLGANIGAASRYFLEAFPASKVIAVEPDFDNAKMCQMNLACYGPRVKIVQAAVWNKNTSLTFERESIGAGTEAGVQVREHQSDADVTRMVRAIDMPTLLSEIGVPDGSQIAVKMDVEGSEEEIFNGTNLDWLDDVSCIAIELHDRIRKDCSKNFFSAVGSRLVDAPRTINDTVFVRLTGRRAR